jgi:8-oxo-dGTP pyrophosphatase MutT (NUDIX family)
MGGGAQDKIEAFGDAETLIGHITDALNALRESVMLSDMSSSDATVPSSVLFLLGPRCGEQRRGPIEPCVILNKRSTRVKQPGDLCFPGGSISYAKDAWIARLLRIPGLPLSRWRHWPEWKALRPDQARRLAILLATGLREAYEEMRLNPFGVGFLGPLPAQPVSMFQRVIHPMVVWVSNQRRFTPNWEVETVVSIPVRALLDPSRYAQYHLSIESREGPSPSYGVFPCFLHESGRTREILWGATYRIVTTLIEIVFGFVPPPTRSLPAVRGDLGKNYFAGSR